MYLPKKDIYDLLKDNLECGVAQTQPTAFNDLPFVNFEVSNNSVSLMLDNDIGYQNIEVSIHIWADNSVEASNLLSTIEGLMRNDGYRLTYSADVPNIGDIFHTITRFTKIIG